MRFRFLSVIVISHLFSSSRGFVVGFFEPRFAFTDSRQRIGNPWVKYVRLITVHCSVSKEESSDRLEIPIF